MLYAVVTSLMVGLLVIPSFIEGFAKYVELLPNGGDVPNASNLGHLDPAGETGLSVFGKAFSKFNTAWSVALCQEDTDGDGYTNGQELGDPCCTWTPTSVSGLITDGLSNPSEVSMIPTNSELLAGCTKGGNDSASSGIGFTNSGENTTGMVGTVAPIDPARGGMPPDDDEDDSSESAVLSAGTTARTAGSCVALGLAMAVAIAVGW